MARRPIEYVSSSQADATASPGTSITVNTPAGVQAGDIMLAFIVRNRDEHDSIMPFFDTITGVTPTWNIPDPRSDSANYADGGNPSPGWATRFCFAWRIAVAGEGASHAFTMAATPDNIRAGVIVAYRYAGLWPDISDLPQPLYDNAAVAGAVGLSVGGVADGRLITVTSRGGGPTLPSATVRNSASGSSGATTCYVTVGDQLLTVNGATGTRTVSGGTVGPSPEVTKTCVLVPRNYPATLMQ